MIADDAAIIGRCLSGDREAFGELVRRYEHAVYGLALSQVRDFDVAEDLAQEAFIAAYRHLPRLSDPSKFGAWIKATAVNLCRNWRRNRRTEQASTEQVMADIRGHGESPIPPDRRYETSEARRHTLAAINRLSDTHAQTLILYYVSGMTTVEIAKTLVVKPATVEQRLHRARKQLKEEIMTMVNKVLKKSHPGSFPEKVLKEISKRAEEARDAHDHVQAVQHYNTALDILDDLDASEEQKRWKADMLWGRGLAGQFLKRDRNKEMLENLEAAVLIEEEMGDRKKYAEHLLGLGVAYSGKDPQRSFRLYHQAESIFESIGDRAGQGQCLSKIAIHHIPWWPEHNRGAGADYEQALNAFRRAVDLFHQAGETIGEAANRAAVRLLETTGASPESIMTQSIGVGCTCLERAADGLIWTDKPGMGMFELTSSKEREEPVNAVFAYLLYPSTLIPYPIQTGVHRAGPVFAYGTAKMQAATHIGLDAEVETPAGAFRACLLVKTDFTIMQQDQDQAYASLNLWHSGTREMWFAPGVGLVRLRYRHGGGIRGERREVETTVQLIDRHVPELSEDYFPLQMGARWVFRITNLYSSYTVRDYWQVEAMEGDRAVIAQYHHAEEAQD